MTGPSGAPATGPSTLRRWVLIGDGESPHLLKWAQALAASGRVELWAASSRGFLPGFEACVPDARRLALRHATRHAGGNLGLLRHLPRLGRWLAGAQPDVLHAHYLTSHGTLAWMVRRGWGLDSALVASAWGSDILVAPRRAPLRWLTRRVLAASVLATSDSRHMARAMQALGAREVLTFSFGLMEETPPPSPGVEPWQVYANRALEPLYRPERVLDLFEALLSRRPQARLVVAHDGSLRAALQARCEAPGSPLAGRVEFTGRLDAEAQVAHYRRSGLYLSLPASDSVSVSVLEAMAHGAIPLLSDLPANRELVRDGENGLIVPDGGLDAAGWARLEALQARADVVRQANHSWVAGHALFPQAVARFLDRVDAVLPPPRARAAGRGGSA